jgi:DNA mismatch endonuclease (patch repair protein)
MKETPEARSRIMRAVKDRDTAPELIVRRLAHRMGYRFRLCRKDLPGRPDVVFPRLRKVIFVHGVSGTATIARAGRAFPNKIGLTG